MFLLVGEGKKRIKIICSHLKGSHRTERNGQKWGGFKRGHLRSHYSNLKQEEKKKTGMEVKAGK